MSKKLRKPLSWLLTFCMLISLFCGMVPVASAEALDESIYNQDGISISLHNQYPTTPKDVKFTVIVEGETVVNERIVKDVGLVANSLSVDAEGYTVTYTGENTYVDAGVLTLTSNSQDKYSVIINLASEKKSDAIAITNGSIDYGTFHWQKNNAGNTAYSRTLTVYVNEKETYRQTINTPQILLGDQYWFVPNGTMYTLDYIDPSSSLDFGTMKDIDVYLITKCGCGLDTCQCKGGCKCPINCVCSACQGTNLTDHQIDTGYGIIEYKDPGLHGGYRFTVEIYVNGQQEFVSPELRIPGSTHAAVKFEPKTGYFYHEPNGYDLDTAMTTSSWSYITGMVTFGGALDKDREYDNTLKIYLWTFEKDTCLDVERRVATSAEQVTGYLISFDAYDPETNSTKTYTYEATSFLAAQPQHIPMGTEVTLTAICPEGKEVTTWSTAEAYANAEFKGIKGEDGTEAYGNTVYLTVNQNTEARVLVYIEGIDNVQAPTDDHLKKLLDDQIIVTCTNEDADHDPDTYKLDLSSVTRPAGVTGNALNKYAYTISIKSDSYVGQYDTATEATHEPARETKQVTLEYDGKDWTVKDGDSPVTFEVECETTPGPKKPDKPEVGDLDFIKVEVECTNTEATHTDPQLYDLLSGGYTIGDVQGDATSGYTCTVTVSPAAYVAKYTADTNVEHNLDPANQSSKEIVVKWENNDWVAADSTSATVKYMVKCTTPVVPGEYDITSFTKSLVYADDATAPDTGAEVKLPSRDETVVIPANGTVTLLYKLTVTGKANVSFTITDTGVQILQSNCGAALDSVDHNKINGIIPTSGIATIYVTKTFTASDIKDGYVINTASIAANNDGTVDPEIEDPEVKTPAEGGKPGAPDEETLEKLLAGKISVSCITASTAHPSETFGWMKDGCILPTAGVTGNATDGWEYVITIDASYYVNYYNNIKLQLPVGTHSPTKDTDPTITLKWTGNGWLCEETIALEAKCTLYTVTVTFDSGEHGDFGWYHVTSKDVELTKGDKLAAYQIPYVFVDEGYEFIGWYENGSGSWHLYSDEELLEMTFDSDATFIAQYKYVGGPSVDDEYDVVYNANFTDGGVPRRQGYDKGETVTVSENKWFERDGYIFVGWNTEADGTGDSYDPDDTFKMPGRDVYLYAQWQKEKPGPDDTGVSRWLETEDHNAYLTGYPDSTFGADRNMTRAEVAQMFYALLKNKNVMITTSFSDVSNDAWYATAVKTMASLGMMSGYPDGTFRPDEPITRAEFATVALAFAYEPDNARCSYLDVSTSAWYYTYVAQATTYGWIGGYPDGTFRPNNSITRVEVCVIVNNMLGRTPDEDYIDRNEDELVNFVDLSDRYWGYYTIMEATNGHEYTGNYSNETWESVK